jgi:hypothetical protein
VEMEDAFMRGSQGARANGTGGGGAAGGSIPPHGEGSPYYTRHPPHSGNGPSN